MGKSAIVRFFGRTLGYQRGVRVVHCYKDMTSRDLLQRRITKENGDTQWEYSPLIQVSSFLFFFVLL
jgi:MoxR-like ATPase